MNERRHSSGRILASVAIICFTAGLASAAWLHVDDAPTTRAGLFAAPVLDLELASDTRVDGFVGNLNLAPGDRVSGTLRVYVEGNAPADLQDLDFDVRLHVAGESEERATALAKALFVKRLSYGRDDLLTASDGGRNLTLEIDANPLLGDNDGRLTLDELRAGANDLPPPRTLAEGATGFTIELNLDERITSLPEERLRVTFVFRLGDRADADLNAGR